ncbi:hypothetical protein [Pseudomonas sp. Irchel s3f7]|uniref:hypothetical protein n=1 Tax=Pseudomonas sp. Irchel s3f7 TaxID=2009153 RepID=UPI000BA31425|nr:hypothetical protein [Pseudomonas sp. Irchel s3f7]
MSGIPASQSEVRALGLALQCLAASLKQNGALNADLYTARLQSHINAEYPAAENKEIFNLVLENLVSDLARIEAPAA